MAMSVLRGFLILCLRSAFSLLFVLAGQEDEPDAVQGPEDDDEGQPGVLRRVFDRFTDRVWPFLVESVVNLVGCH